MEVVKTFNNEVNCSWHRSICGLIRSLRFIMPSSVCRTYSWVTNVNRTIELFNDVIRISIINPKIEFLTHLFPSHFRCYCLLRVTWLLLMFHSFLCFILQLVSLYDIKPPISKAKMTAITKAAMKSVKFYKHVVHGVEKFILKVSASVVFLSMYNFSCIELCTNFVVLRNSVGLITRFLVYM